MTVNLF